MQVLGHRAIVDRLWAAARSGTLHHAYLFEGAPGLGKRTVADLLVRAVNCVGTDALAPGALPCGRCAACTELAAGAHPDLLVLEPGTSAAGTIAVDDVRDAIRKLGFHRFSARRRFVIVDPAEALPPAAANALLKTLEEPPEGTGFLLIASAPTALLPTIRSRCQRVRFGAVPEAEIAPWLGLADPAEAERCARLSQGCPGRAKALAGGELASRDALRARALEALGGDLAGVYAFSAELTEGKRQEWRGGAGALFEILEDLVRDAAVTGAGSGVPLLNADRPDLVARWAAVLYPGGIAACQRAIAEARDDLASFVTGKTAIDALMTAIATELGPARRG